VASIAQAVEHPDKVQFPIAGLKTELHRAPDEKLRLGRADACAEEIGVASKVIERRERDRVGPALDGDVTGRGKRRDATCEGAYETVERVRGQCSVDPAVALGEVGVVVVGGQHDLQGPGTTQEPRQILGSTSARDLPERGLELTEDRSVSCSKRMSHANTNSLPAPRTRPSICAIVTSLHELR
jgi:hypothetical protein